MFFVKKIQYALINLLIKVDYIMYSFAVGKVFLVPEQALLISGLSIIRFYHYQKSRDVAKHPEHPHVDVWPVEGEAGVDEERLGRE